MPLQSEGGHVPMSATTAQGTAVLDLMRQRFDLVSEATSMFCAMLGTIVGNLALSLGARGGIFAHLHCRGDRAEAGAGIRTILVSCALRSEGKIPWLPGRHSHVCHQAPLTRSAGCCYVAQPAPRRVMMLQSGNIAYRCHLARPHRWMQSRLQR